MPVMEEPWRCCKESKKSWWIWQLRKIKQQYVRRKSENPHLSKMSTWEWWWFKKNLTLLVKCLSLKQFVAAGIYFCGTIRQPRAINKILGLFPLTLCFWGKHNHFFGPSFTSIQIVLAISLQQFAEVWEPLHWCYHHYFLYWHNVILSLINSKYFVKK